MILGHLGTRVLEGTREIEAFGPLGTRRALYLAESPSLYVLKTIFYIFF